MKFSRIVASGGAMALIGASVFLGAGAAQADAYFVTVDDFGMETPASYPEDLGWFTGDMNPRGEIKSTPDGLEVTGPMQILNNDTTKKGILELVDELEVWADGPVTFQLPVYTGAGETEFTTFRPAPGTSYRDIDNLHWITSQTWGPYDSGDTATLTEFVSKLHKDHTLLAYGLFVKADDTATVEMIGWGDKKHYFMPEPTAVATPSEMTVEALRESGTTATFTNMPVFDNYASCAVMPGDATEFQWDFDWNSPGDTDKLFWEFLERNEDGSVTVTYLPDGDVDLANGPYSIGCFVGEIVTPANSAIATFTIAAEQDEIPPPAEEDEAETPVVPVPEDAVPAPADPTAAPAPAPALAATGVDSGPLALAAGLLVLGGLAFTAVTVRRRVSMQ